MPPFHVFTNDTPRRTYQHRPLTPEQGREALKKDLNEWRLSPNPVSLPFEVVAIGLHHWLSGPIGAACGVPEPKITRDQHVIHAAFNDISPGPTIGQSLVSGATRWKDLDWILETRTPDTVAETLDEQARHRHHFLELDVAFVALERRRGTVNPKLTLAVKVDAVARRPGAARSLFHGHWLSRAGSKTFGKWAQDEGNRLPIALDQASARVADQILADVFFPLNPIPKQQNEKTIEPLRNTSPLAVR